MEITRTSATLPAPAADRALPAPKPREAAVGTDSAEEPSTLKAFAYGVLDLDKPETATAEESTETAETDDTESAYTAGKWLGAAAKVGGIISLLI